MERKKPILSIFLLTFAFVFATDKINTQEEEYEPILISSGFNEDVIAEDSPAEDYTTSPVDGTNSGANNAFMSEDFPGANSGLPANGKIHSETTEGLTFQLADYAENNSLRLVDNNEEGTLVLENATTADKIFILATSGNGSADFTGEIHFSDDSTQEINSQNVPDWYNNFDNVVIKGIGRVSLSNDGVDNNA